MFKTKPLRAKSTPRRPPASHFRPGKAERMCNIHAGVNYVPMPFRSAFCESEAFARASVRFPRHRSDKYQCKAVWISNLISIAILPLSAIKFTAPWDTLVPREVPATLMASALWSGWPCHPLGLFSHDILGRLLLSPHCIPGEQIPILPVVLRGGTAIYSCQEISFPWRSPSSAKMISKPTNIALL